MKRVLCFFLVSCIIFLMTFSVSAASNEENVLLSEMSDAECLSFLQENGLAEPDFLENEAQCLAFARYIIRLVEENPRTLFTWGYTEMLLYANKVKQAVNEHYGTNEIAVCSQSTSNILQDNEVDGIWSAEYNTYNCYGYAINTCDMVDPGYYAWLYGDTEDQFSFDDTQSIGTIANLVKSDLEALGYTVATPVTTMPNTVVTECEHLICVRRDDDGILAPISGEAAILYDYHFMKKEGNNWWYHKPGMTIPLKYKYVPKTSLEWVSESFNGTYYSRTEDWTYESTIYYIEYTTHDYEFEYYGANRHILTCTTCGGTSGSPEYCIERSDTCIICGHYSGGIQIMALDNEELTLE